MLKQTPSLILESKRCSAYAGGYVRGVISLTALRDCLNENSEGQA
jgi:hypothetical protein